MVRWSASAPMPVGHGRAGSGGQSPPSLSMARATSGLWEPRARRVRRRSLVAAASRRAFESLCSRTSSIATLSMLGKSSRCHVVTVSSPGSRRTSPRAEPPSAPSPRSPLSTATVPLRRRRDRRSRPDARPVRADRRRAPHEEVHLDIDSRVEELFGRQEGAELGHNLVMPGRSPAPTKAYPTRASSGW